MPSGLFFFVVGASGVGKDTLIAGAMDQLGSTHRYVQARLVITRPAGPHEDHEPISAGEFARRQSAGLFLHSWDAHGLQYGLPEELHEHLAAGQNIIANGSRATLSSLLGKVSPLVVIEIAARGDILKRRILDRGWETVAEAEAQLAVEVAPLPPEADVITVMNNTSVQEGIAALVNALETALSRMALRRIPIRAGRANIAYLQSNGTDAASTYLDGNRIDISGHGRSIRARVNTVDPGWHLSPGEIGISSEAFDRLGIAAGSLVALQRMPSPSSRRLLRRKIDGEKLDAKEYATLFRDIAEDRYPESEVAAFLVATIQTLDDDEVVAVAQARCSLTPRIDWGAPIVVDKHSLGGVPGNRLTLIVVPIVAAHGMLMPKTSSRAITSASGTADVMEAACRVDLDAAEVQRVVGHAGGCIVWNGRLNYSPLDDIVNDITRPLELNSNRWSVASILSKKWAAGSTHVVVDLPYGPHTKLRNFQEARELEQLFEHVGEGLGLSVHALASAAPGAIGRGIGPVLELRDVRLVLSNNPAAPQDLREKSLRFAAKILSFDPDIGTEAAGRLRAEHLLTSYAAMRRFEAIVDAQGRRDPLLPGTFTETVWAKQVGCVTEIDGWRVAGIARRAGAPSDKGAGIDLAVRAGEPVTRGMALYTIHASTKADLDAARQLAAEDDGITITEVAMMTA